MTMRVENESILTYGQVELCLYQQYAPGELVIIDHCLRLEILDRADHADGIIILGFIPNEDAPRPTCLCVLFSHYIRRYGCDGVDHSTTLSRLTHPTEADRVMTEAIFKQDLYRRSPSASLTFKPQVRYL